LKKGRYLLALAGAALLCGILAYAFRGKIQEMKLYVRWFGAVAKNAHEHNRPIDFYARIVDQEGKGVSNVQVEAEIRYYKTIVGPKDTFTGGENLSRQSDENGRFSIQGYNGTTLLIKSLRKDGYIDLHGSGDFNYGYKSSSVHTSSPASPTVLHVWKRVGNSKTVSGQLTTSYAPVLEFNTWYYLDLQKSVIKFATTPGSHSILQLKVERKAFSVEPFTVLLEGLNRTQVIETKDAFLFSAPASGYQDRVSAALPALSTVKIYMHKRDENIHGAMLLELRARPEQIVLNGTYRLNLSGGRDLEPAETGKR
jgi:hypothetical protein